MNQILPVLRAHTFAYNFFLNDSAEGLAGIFVPAANFVLAAFFLLAEILGPAANFVPAAIFC